jgi:hypothetical protein
LGVLFGLGETVAAEDRFITTGLKWHFGLRVALSASGGIHLARTSVGITAAVISHALGSSGRTARRTPLRFVGEAFGGEEFLFFSREGESFAAIGTLKGFLCISH